MDNPLLLVPISAHLFLDVLLFKDELILPSYIFIIIFFYTVCLKLFKDFSIIFFIMLSMYRFSRDFSYLNDGNNVITNYSMGGIIITSTIYRKAQWKYILDLMTSSPRSSKKIIIFLELLDILFSITVLINIFRYKQITEVYYIFLYRKIFENSNPLDTIVYYLAFFHTPINIYKSYILNSKETNLLFSIGIFVNCVVYILKRKKFNIQTTHFIISISISHMIFRSL